VTNNNSTDEEILLQRRILNHRYYGLYENFELVPEWFLIVEALELKIRPGEPDTDP
jgi:hypothetical protein